MSMWYGLIETTTTGKADIYFRRSNNSGYSFPDAIKNLSNNLGGPSTPPPQPQIDASGNNVYVVWHDTTTTTSTSSVPAKDDIFLTKSTDGGAIFSDTINLSNENLAPQVAVSGSNVYVMWVDETTGNRDILFKRITDSGATFSNTPINLSNNTEFSSHPQIAASGNNVYVIWFDRTTGNGDIYFRRSTDSGATFRDTINLSNDTGMSGSPQIAVSGNNVYVVWYDNRINENSQIFDEIYFKRSTDGGASFSNTPINLSNTTGGSYSPQIAASGNNVYVVWRDQTTGNADIFFARSTDGGVTFNSIPINLSNNTGRSAEPQIAVSGNNVYVVWHDTTDTVVFGNEDIFFKRSTNNGATFSNTINLSMNAAKSLYPQIAISGNNVYVVWTDLALEKETSTLKEVQMMELALVITFPLLLTALNAQILHK